jgi:hypothetical protein
MRFTSVAEFLDPTNGHRPTTAERKLIKATQAGEACYLCDEKTPSRPAEATDGTRIRAALLRIVITGGTPDCGLHKRGLSLFGGWVNGALDLSYCNANGQTALLFCEFPDEPRLEAARFQLLNLSNSHFSRGLYAQGIKVEQHLFLRKVTAHGTISLGGSTIGGQVSCAKASLDSGVAAAGKPKRAFHAQGVATGESLFLSDIIARGTVDLSGAQIGGQLSCTGVDLDGQGGLALDGQHLRVTQGFFFRKLKSVKGRIDLTAANVGDLVDDVACWPQQRDQLILDGFTYNRIEGPTAFADRSSWLEYGSHWQGDFYPQPYIQLATVLRRMGHSGEARKVLKERESLLATHLHSANRAAYQRALAGEPTEKGDAGWIWLRMTGAWLWSELTRRVAGYGYAPQFALYWSIAFVAASFFAYFFFWRLGAMVPADAILLASPEWAAAVASNPKAPSHAWHGPAATHYETFYSLTYALDVFLPIVDLGQQSTWGQTTATWWGWSARLYTWALQIAGWVVTTLDVAAVTGVIQRNQPD